MVEYWDSLIGTLEFPPCFLSFSLYSRYIFFNSSSEAFSVSLGSLSIPKELRIPVFTASRSRTLWLSSLPTSGAPAWVVWGWPSPELQRERRSSVQQRRQWSVSMTSLSGRFSFGCSVNVVCLCDEWNSWHAFIYRASRVATPLLGQVSSTPLMGSLRAACHDSAMLSSIVGCCFLLLFFWQLALMK